RISLHRLAVLLEALNKERSSILFLVADQDDLLDVLLLARHELESHTAGGTATCSDALKSLLPGGEVVAGPLDGIGHGVERVNVQLLLADRRDQGPNALAQLDRQLHGARLVNEQGS